MQLADFPCYVEGFDDGVNLRDLGGWPTAEGKRTKRGLIYRSGRLSDLSTAEIVRLLQLKLACIVDGQPTRRLRIRTRGFRPLFVSGLMRAATWEIPTRWVTCRLRR